MCLYNDKYEVEKLLKSGKKKIKCWKLVYLNKRLISKHYSYTWGAGVNKSSSKLTKPCKKHGQEIHHGIHVFLNKPNYPSQYERVIPVWCELKDLLGANEEFALFKKVTLTEKDYLEALK